MTAMAVAKRERTTTIIRPLKILIPLIRIDLEAGDRAAMTHYADAGDKLIEAQSQVALGHWGTWLLKNFDLGRESARRYMRLAKLRIENIKNTGAPGNLPSSLESMVGGTERHRERRAAKRTFESVLRDVEPDLYAQEKQTREDEVRLHREIALELVDIGYKALSTRLHPDHGGSHKAMARLNHVRAELKRVAETRRFV